MNLEKPETQEKPQNPPDLSSHQQLLAESGFAPAVERTANSGLAGISRVSQSGLLSSDKAAPDSKSTQPESKFPLPPKETALGAALILGTAVLATALSRGSALASVENAVVNRGAGSGIARLELGAANGASRLETMITNTTERQIGLPLSSRLALDTSSDLASQTPLSLTINRPLPRFATISGSAGQIAPMSERALQQSQEYVGTGLLSARLEDGVRLPVVVDSAGFTKFGVAANPGEKFLVVDRNNDPILRAALDDVKQRYAGMSPSPAMAMDLRNHVSQLMNRFNMEGEDLVRLYEETLRRNGSEIPIGLFLGRGGGVCLPRAAVFKTMADDLQLPTRIREGLVGIKRPQPHVWNEVDFNAKWQVYDPSHAPNPLFRYTSTKH